MTYAVATENAMAQNPFSLVPPDSPSLRQKSRPVRTDEIFDLRKSLYWLVKLMTAAGGIGLAANQIGDCRRYFVWDRGMVINPEVLVQSTGMATMQETCLSFPGVFKQIERPYKISVRFTDESGILQDKTYDGRYARVFQHELDHLNGICIA